MLLYITRTCKRCIRQHLILLLISLSIVACSSPDPETHSGNITNDSISAPLPSAVAALTLDNENLDVQLIVNDQAERLNVEDLVIDTENNTFSGEIDTLEEGSHSLSLVFSIFDPTVGKVEIARTDAITVSVVANETTPANFGAVSLHYTDTDADSFSNLDELKAGTSINEAHYRAGGTVSGLSGSGLELQLNDANTIPVSVNGDYSFSVPVANSVSYRVSVTKQPESPAQLCTVTNASGTINGAHVTNVNIDCSVINPPPTNEPPNGSIDTPSTDITIMVGEAVNFSASANDPDNHTPLSYQWDFGGDTNNVMQEDPGEVIFDTVGSYTVTFTVTDSLNLADPTPASRTVNVVSAVNRPFITTWKTDNPGISNDNQIMIKTAGEGYNYRVDWGDGQVDHNVTGDIIHTYASAGTYTVSISGDFPRIIFDTDYNDESNDAEKLLSVDQWGNIAWQSMHRAFAGCKNLVVNTNDAPDLSRVNDMSAMFQGASLFNQDINHWDVSTVTDMSWMFSLASTFNQPLNSWDVSAVAYMSSMFRDANTFNQDISNWNVSAVSDMDSMFRNASTFNQDLSSWDVSAVTNMEKMFSGITLSTENYDALLLGWSAQSLQNNVTFHGGNSQYSSTRQANRDTVTGGFGWTVADGGVVNDQEPPVNIVKDAFITTWKTDNPGISNDNQIMIKTAGEGYNYRVDWGDGQVDLNVAGDITHTYANAGTYTVSISGDFPRIIFDTRSKDENNDAKKLLSVEQWGDIAWQSMHRAFAGCRNLVVNASNEPDLSRVTDMSSMFAGAAAFNKDISSWDVSAVRNMKWMFSGASAFNQSLNGWDVSAVTDMSWMFSFASTFNQDLDTWTVSAVKDMTGMFFRAPSFNQYLNSWDVSAVRNMSRMFSGASAFNQSLSVWNVSAVTNMSEMFYNASSFNQDLSDWEVSAVTNMSKMFRGASAFNQPLSWKNISAVTNMNEMFTVASAFNQDISSWDVSAVKDMNRMFAGASAFNQDLGSWDVSAVTDMRGMFSEVTLSTANYDALLFGWSSQSLQSGVTLNAGNSKYSSARQANRDTLTRTFGWTVTDGGLSE